MTAKGEKLLVAVTSLLLILCISIIIFDYRWDGGQALPSSEGVVSENVIREAYFEPVQGTEADIVVPLPKDAEGQFYIEETLSEKEIRIVFENVGEAFFHQNKIKGNQEKIRQVYFVKEAGQTSLVFSLKHIYEGKMSTENGEISFRLQNPTEMYERIFVFDGILEEDREVVSKILQPQMTGVFGGGVETANELRADCYVSLVGEVVRYDAADSGESESVAFGTAGDKAETGTDNHTEVMIYYNDDYYIPQFDSRDFAQALQKGYEVLQPDWKVTVMACDNECLKDARVPAVKIVYQIFENVEVTDAENVQAAEGKVESLLAEILVKQFGKLEEQ